MDVSLYYKVYSHKRIFQTRSNINVNDWALIIKTIKILSLMSCLNEYVCHNIVVKLQVHL